MKGRRPQGGAPTPAGVLPLVKPPGMTSHDVVDCCRRWLQVRRVGHAGTLDPAAAGVLVVCVGAATRLAEYLSDMDKRYWAEIWLGVRTDSHDSDGRVEEVMPVARLDRSAVERALDELAGLQHQVPPAVSAVRHGGRRAYQWHRRGQSVALPPRPVRIHRLALLDWHPGPYPRLRLEVHCSKGTYIRALARDLGDRLGCGATLVALVRVAQGPFRLEDAVPLEQLAAAAEAGRAPELWLNPAEALSFLPAWVLTEEEVRRVLNGGTPDPRSDWRGPGRPGPSPGAGPSGSPAEGGGLATPPGRPRTLDHGPAEEEGVRTPAAAQRVRLLAPAGDLVAVARLTRCREGWLARPEKVLRRDAT